MVAIIPEGIRVAPIPEGVGDAIIPEGVVVEIIPKGIVAAIISEGVGEATTPEDVREMIDWIFCPIREKYYVIKRIYPKILVCSYYIISKESASITFNTFLCFNAFIVRGSIPTKSIKEYAKGIAIDSPC